MRQRCGCVASEKSAMNAATRARASRTPSPWTGPVLAAAVAAALLYAVMLVHAAGESLLAMTLLLITALALWTYTSRRTGASRYLFPGIAAAVVFVIFPMLYTIGIGFTNYSSTNLLDAARAKAYLLDESTQAAGSERAFSLHREGPAWRVHLLAAEGRPALSSGPLPLIGSTPQEAALQEGSAPPAPAVALNEVVPLLPSLRALTLRTPQGQRLSLATLREFAESQPVYRAMPDGSLADQINKTTYRPDDAHRFLHQPRW
jgi:maltose/maltodextrin transport system permease protein